ncbi:CoA transferase [Paraburkholderia sp. J11-2]|uniref:CoA transferase n=1 Tax=Paraburkholderia sp. J11-2 TaxID=2805431 RepID=UPI002AB68222|nr:CoA transferase [Paraburkholderia sp. J11-2]
MESNDEAGHAALPLAGCRVLEHSRTVAAAWAGRLLAAMGARVVMMEPPQGHRLRGAAPLIDGSGESALFAYLAAGKHSLLCDLATSEGKARFEHELERADILIDDTPLAERESQGLDAKRLGARFAQLVHVSVLPFGAHGPKAAWDGEEVNLLHAGGEGYLLPNGLSGELFPQRAPLKIYGHFAGYQGGCTAALAALTAWWAVPSAGGQYVDVSVQDAALAVGAFALQRLGDGSLEHRSTRSFRYGGVFEAKDGFVEVLTLEDRQWSALVQLLGSPAWAQEEALRDPLERSRRGGEINRHIRAWMAQERVEDIVRRAQALGVPAAKYRTPEEVLAGAHESARGLFAQATLPDGRAVDVLVAPFQFRCTTLEAHAHVPAPGELEKEDC